MARQSNAAPVIVKRKKIVAGGGHHGGAWKVAYADFVTAMMAFFMLMWLLNATTEKQRKGLADYFNPTIPINRISGGGDGAFGGDSVFAEQTLAQNGTGATNAMPTDRHEARGETGLAATTAEAALRETQAAVEQMLSARGGESMTMQRALRHVITRVTDEGLVIEVFDLPEAPLFAEDTALPGPLLRVLAQVLAEALAIATNDLALNGHLAARALPLRDQPSWELSSARAEALRVLLQDSGVRPARFARVSGFADRKPATADPTAVRNNRLEVVLLRRDR
jgi:chemotaxis protein MotB